MKLEVKWMNITTLLDCRIHENGKFSFNIRYGRAKSLKISSICRWYVNSFLAIQTRVSLFTGKSFQSYLLKSPQGFVEISQFSGNSNTNTNWIHICQKQKIFWTKVHVYLFPSFLSTQFSSFRKKKTLLHQKIIPTNWTYNLNIFVLDENYVFGSCGSFIIILFEIVCFR